MLLTSTIPRKTHHLETVYFPTYINLQSLNDTIIIRRLFASKINIISTSTLKVAHVQGNEPLFIIFTIENKRPLTASLSVLFTLLLLSTLLLLLLLLMLYR